MNTYAPKRVCKRCRGTFVRYVCNGTWSRICKGCRRRGWKDNV